MNGHGLDRKPGKRTGEREDAESHGEEAEEGKMTAHEAERDNMRTSTT